MKTKDLFKAIESHNFIASRTNGKRAFIICNTLTLAHGYVIELSAENARTGDNRFSNWNDFAASIADDYSEDVCALVAKGTLKETSDKEYFSLEDKNYCDGMALRFYIYNN